MVPYIGLFTITIQPAFLLLHIQEGGFIQKNFRSIRTIEPAMCALNGNIASQFQSTGYQAEPLYSMNSAPEVRRPGGNLRPIPAPPHSLAYIKTATFRR